VDFHKLYIQEQLNSAALSYYFKKMVKRFPNLGWAAGAELGKMKKRAP